MLYFGSLRGAEFLFVVWFLDFFCCVVLFLIRGPFLKLEELKICGLILYKGGKGGC